MIPAVDQFIERIKVDEDLQDKLKRTLKAEELAVLAAEAGFHFTAAELVKSFAQLLLESDDTKAVALFDDLGWDAGELLWSIRGWVG